MHIRLYFVAIVDVFDHAAHTELCVFWSVVQKNVNKTICVYIDR